MNSTEQLRMFSESQHCCHCSRPLPRSAPVWTSTAARSSCRGSRPAYARQSRQQHSSRRGPSLLAAAGADKVTVDVAKMQPLGDRILVEPRDNEQKSAGGLLLTSSSAVPNMQDAIIGKVLAVGGALSEEVKVKVGDKVLYSKYSTSDVETASGNITFVAEKSILAVLS